MTDEPQEVPDGAAVFPEIPAELGIHPLLLAVVHALVFLDGSDEAVINGAAAEEAFQYLLTYLQRLQGPDRQRVREDIETLLGYIKQEGWPAEEQTILRNFLNDCFNGGEANDE